MIGILDYGVGNIQAFKNVYSDLGVPSKAVVNVEDFVGVTHIILPGVGSAWYRNASCFFFLESIKCRIVLFLTSKFRRMFVYYPP